MGQKKNTRELKRRNSRVEVAYFTTRYGVLPAIIVDDISALEDILG
jgi:hypothetical protein